jgi:hypothetical protein
MMHAHDVLLKVGHFTLDNASNNETMMAALAPILAERDISFDAHDRRIMCFAHIINLCSGWVISAVSNGHNNNDDHSSSDDGTVDSDPIAQARAAVRAIRGSGARRVAFDELIVDGNAKGWFKQVDSSEIVTLKSLQLLRDVCTRWDSVYHMLNRLRELHPVWIYTSPNVIRAK